MPDQRYKVAFNLQTFGIGAGETYISRATSESSIVPLVQRLVAARNPLLFDVTKWRNVRLSRYGERRRSTPFPPGTHSPFGENNPLVVPGKGQILSTAVEKRPDQARACLQVRVGFDTDRSVIRYLSFVPDSLLYDEEKGVDFDRAPAGYAAAYVTWRELLVADGWCLRALQKTGDYAPKKIADWVTSAAAPNLMGFVLPAVPAPGIAETEEVQVSGVRRRGADKTSYNGKYVVQSINATDQPNYLIYYLRGTEAGVPSSIRKMGTVNKIAYGEFPFQKYAPLRPGVHKRGRAAGVPVGRRQNRVSL